MPNGRQKHKNEYRFVLLEGAVVISASIAPLNFLGNGKSPSPQR
jgi:hypothetical protein